MAAGVAVGDHVERRLILRLHHKATVEAGLDGSLGAIGHVKPFGKKTRPEVFPKEFDAILKLLDATVVDHVAHEVWVRGRVDRDGHR